MMMPKPMGEKASMDPPTRPSCARCIVFRPMGANFANFRWRTALQHARAATQHVGRAANCAATLPATQTTPKKPLPPPDHPDHPRPPEPSWHAPMGSWERWGLGNDSERWLSCFLPFLPSSHWRENWVLVVWGGLAVGAQWALCCSHVLVIVSKKMV